MNTKEPKPVKINRDTKILLLSILRTGEITSKQGKELLQLLDRETPIMTLEEAKRIIEEL
ncbi:hypothetical protein EZS27_026811 [termite gut metagenome]|uniref:Uncharacterized protein n=1 Tax=termite gut metagenome TaxID=433724 RepID=A0A5J4QPF2_9ZZZZ